MRLYIQSKKKVNNIIQYICLSLSGVSHLPYPESPFILSQVAGFSSFSWLNKFPVCVCVAFSCIFLYYYPQLLTET